MNESIWVCIRELGNGIIAHGFGPSLLINICVYMVEWVSTTTKIDTGLL